MDKKHLSILVKDVAKSVQTIVNKDDTIEEALSKMRHQQIDHKIIYFYVVDSENKLCGIIPTRKLLLCDSTAKIQDIMNEKVISLHQGQNLQEAMQLFARHSLLALPVVDDNDHIIGAVDVEMYMEESFDIADARHRFDIFQMIGISLEDEKKSSIWRNFRLRMPWIFCNMIGGIFCAIIANTFNNVLSHVILLAMFIPLVLSLSESISMQSMTHSIQILRRPRLTRKASFFLALKEFKVVLLMAISAALIVGLISLLWRGGGYASATIGFAILISVIIAASFGILFPIILRKTRLDPKVASGPVVLTLADVLTTSIYLSLATWWLL